MVWRERRRGRRERERNREKDSWHPSVVGDVIEREEGRYEIEKGGERGRERRKKESEREGERKEKLVHRQECAVQQTIAAVCQS